MQKNSMSGITFWMIKNPQIVTKEKSVLDAAKKMAKADSDCIIIIEDKKPIGIFTEADLVKKIVAKKKDPEKTSVGKVMTSPIETVPETAAYTEVLSLMRTKNYRHMPVTNDAGELEGLLTLRSLIQNT